MKARNSIHAVVLLGLFLAATLIAQPGMINYQGKLTDDAGVPVSATVSIVFSIYDVATGGTALWTETQSSVTVQDGIYNVLLGSTNPIPDAVFDGGDRWLGVTVETDSEMSPRQRIASVGYAINSDMVDGQHASDLIQSSLGALPLTDVDIGRGYTIDETWGLMVAGVPSTGTVYIRAHIGNYAGLDDNTAWTSWASLGVPDASSQLVAVSCSYGEHPGGTWSDAVVTVRMSSGKVYICSFEKVEGSSLGDPAFWGPWTDFGNPGL